MAKLITAHDTTGGSPDPSEPLLRLASKRSPDQPFFYVRGGRSWGTGTTMAEALQRARDCECLCPDECRCEQVDHPIGVVMWDVFQVWKDTVYRECMNGVSLHWPEGSPNEVRHLAPLDGNGRILPLPTPADA